MIVGPARRIPFLPSRARFSFPPSRARAMSALSYTAERSAELQANVKAVRDEIAASRPSSIEPRLVSISKIKPASDIQALYDAGERHFGENYVQELVDKAEILPRDINWHFVGSVQSNKAKVLASIPNLFVLETLSSIKVADLLQKSLSSERKSPLNVYIQVNTSGEDAKSGVAPLDASADVSAPLVEIALHVLRNCPGLNLLGLMTIGSWEASHDSTQANPDFEALKQSRDRLQEILAAHGQERRLELSMGMSADFAQAVKEGSDSVRVGTRIFGERPKKDA